MGNSLIRIMFFLEKLLQGDYLMGKESSKLHITELQIIINFILVIGFSMQSYDYWATGKIVLALFYLTCLILVSTFNIIGFLLLKNKNNNKNHEI